MIYALLVGFGYSGGNYLPGIIVDLYIVYSWCLRLGIRPMVVTDITKDEEGQNIYKALVKDIVDVKVINFIENIQKTHYYCKFSASKTSKDFATLLNHITISDTHRQDPTLGDQFIFYFSGHGLQESLLLPDFELFKWEAVRDILLKRLNNKAQILWINDCCHSYHLNLKYKMVASQNSFCLSKLDPPTYYYTDKEVVCLLATSELEKSMASYEGSMFTRGLFELLSKKERFLGPLLKKLQHQVDANATATKYKTTLQVYSSLPGPLVLWGWLYHQHIHINLNMQIKSLEIDLSSDKKEGEYVSFVY